MEELTGTQLFRAVLSPVTGRREDVLPLLDGDALRELKRLRAAAAAAALYWAVKEGDEELLEGLARALGLGVRERERERGPEGDDADAEGAGPASEGEDDRADDGDERRDDDREDDRFTVPEGYELEGYEVMTVVEEDRAYVTKVPVLRLKSGFRGDRD